MKILNTLSVLAIASVMASCAAPELPGFEATNRHDSLVVGKAFVLDREALEPLIQGELSPDNAVLVTDNLGRVAFSQLDDIDVDGQWDELAFLADFEAHQTLKFVFQATPLLEMPKFPKLTNVRFGYVNEPFDEVESELRLKSNDSPSISAVYQMEGPAWENELVGFRNYYDARNGIDIFGKRVPAMVLDSAGIRGQNYHELDEWGMDILKVGNSLGAGAIAIGVGDSLYRVGPCENGSYRFIAEGPVRALFELTYTNVPAGNRFYDVTHRISIFAGDHFYRSDVWVDNLQGDEVLYTGIVDMHNLPVFEMQSSEYNISGTHGKQAYTGETLGMGLLIPSSQFVHYREAPAQGEGIIQTHLAAIKLDEGGAARYAFFSGWELQDSSFVNPDYFKEQLLMASRKLSDQNW